MVELGSIEQVDLREVWSHEAQDFTPWLAGNLDKLGEVLGLDLELRSAEAAVGPFSLDVLAHDLGSNRPVIIENQLEETNHDHLGKLLTYAAGYDAYAVVWLTKEFRDEHRQAVDWLNQRTDENTQFFGVVVEAWKIDQSRPAPHFRVVAMPNDWHKRLTGVERQTRSRVAHDQNQRYAAFWQDFGEMMDEINYVGEYQDRTASWVVFESEFTGITWNASIQPRGRAFAELYLSARDMGREWADHVYERLEERRDTIEEELGLPLNWETHLRARNYRISAERAGRINDDEQTLAELREWMRDQFIALNSVLSPVIQEIVDIDVETESVNENE